MRAGDTAHRAAGDSDHPREPDPGLCRVADLEIFPAGDGLSLVYARDSGAAGFYRPDVLALLTACREFAPIEQHVRDYLGSGVGGASEPALRRELARLRAAGFLVTAGGVGARADGAAAPPPISVIGIPTCDRPGLLRRAISGYAANCARHGRRVAVVVADDSPGSTTRQDCRAMLKDLARVLDIDIFYAGLEEKSAFARRLASAGDIPLDVVRFGCLPGPRPGVTIGANRNALLLHTAGEPIFTADDDTVCEVSVPPGHRGGLALDSGGDPLQRWFFASRDDAAAAAARADYDLLGGHGRYLGQAPAPLLAAAGPAGVGDSDPALLRRILSGSGRIRVTANGVLGDCGWDNRDYYLFQNDATFARLVSSPASFAAARGCRELIQSVTTATITASADPRFAMCMGLDNTELLPPFPPSGRAEEVGFGALLTACFGAYAAHLPVLMRHDPPDHREFSEASPFSICLGSWLPACISRFDPGLAASPAARLRAFGSFLDELARLPAGAFDEFTRLVMWDSMSALTGRLDERLHGADPPPGYWAREAREFMARVRRAALAPAAESYKAIGGRSALQDLLGQFGKLLTWWPAMVATARQLRGAGERMAGPVR
jgi:hypothetical protein